MSEVFEIILRGAIAFFFPLLFIHLTGKQWLGQTTYAYFIGAISMGSIAGNTVFNIKIKLIYFVISLTAYCIILYLSSIVAMKSRRMRKWIQGEPTLIISNGTVMDEAIQKLHYSMDNLKSALRKKDIFDIDEVERALLEPDGSVSVLKKKDFRGVTRKDMSTGPIELILEGKLLEGNVNQDAVLLEKLHEELRGKKLMVADLQYAVQGTNGKLYIVLRK
jgi:uncharacterized membrane protein YcaP (DUF421 family)